ncbi:M91 family zinc metallopeptidase [Luteimonas sp. A478]
MSLNLDPTASSASLVQAQQQYWDTSVGGGEKFAEAPLRSDMSAPVETSNDSATDGAVTISGTDAGSSLPGKQTPDGKNIRNAQLHQGEQATVTREQTQAGLFSTSITSDQVVFTTNTQGDAHVRVSQRDDGTLDIDVNGESYEVRLTERQELTIRTGAGNDVIEAAPNVTVNMVVDAGAGDDHIVTGMGDDRILGGDGNDFIQTIGGRNDIDGGSGDDVIHTGDGADVVYGGRGNDQVHAGGGFNYIDGGRGDDVIHGGGGQNIISAGGGNDEINLVGGDANTVYAGAGTSTVNGAGAGDTVYAKASDLINTAGMAAPTVINVEIDPELGRSIEVTGSDTFRERMEAELDFLRASPAGQQMLAELDAAAEKGNVVTIRELANEQNGFAQTMDRRNAEIRNGEAGSGSDVLVSYNPSFHMDAFPSSNVVLFHELSHAFNGVTGTFQPGNYTGGGPDNGISNAERQAVGLETSNDPFDYDGDPSTPPTTHNPIHLTENGIRREMGLPDRPSYRL